MEATSCAGESQRSALQPAQSPSLLLRPAGILSGQGRAAWDDLPTRHCHADCCPFLFLGARGQKVFPDINFQIDTSHTHPEEIARRLLAQTFKGECTGHLPVSMYCECECYLFLCPPWVPQEIVVSLHFKFDPSVLRALLAGSPTGSN